MTFLLMNLLLLAGVLVAGSLAYTPWPKLRVNSVQRLFVSAVVLGVLGTLLLAVLHLLVNDYYYQRFDLGQYLSDTLYMARVTVPLLSIVALSSTSFAISLRALRRKLSDNLKDGKGFFDGSGRTKQEALLDTVALLFSVAFIGLAAAYGFLLWALATGRLD